MNPLQFNSSSLAICNMNSKYFPSTKKAGLVDSGAVHINLDTVDLGGRSELGEWLPHNPTSGRLMWNFYNEAGHVNC